ncbi:17854_t:CDS:1 [Funneliformis caledonium]|uniref:17854_t:CDS:1 n=1 Tax=Funneliformis caledonium TaxID=1117310 RepID=A0A9N8YNQ1_9GLOM|nr:17854_t:CDS:1 [Funneliformis caledonium]
MSRKYSVIRPTRNMKKNRNEPMVEIPDFEIPFPPKVTAQEIVAQRPPCKLGSRPPNIFFLYRMNYIKALKKILPNISMRPLSKHISESWRQEPEDRKEAYKVLFDQVEKALESRRRQDLILVSEDFPKVPRNNANTMSTNVEEGNKETNLQQDPQTFPEGSISTQYPNPPELLNLTPTFPLFYNYDLNTYFYYDDYFYPYEYYPVPYDQSNM